MLNAEKHKESVEQFNYNFGVTKTNKIVPCIAANCSNTQCKFHKSQSCAQARVKWLLETATAQTHEEILNVLKQVNGTFAINKFTGEVMPCENFTTCSNCAFANSNHRCEENRYNWLVDHGFIK